VGCAAERARGVLANPAADSSGPVLRDLLASLTTYPSSRAVLGGSPAITSTWGSQRVSALFERVSC